MLTLQQGSVIQSCSSHDGVEQWSKTHSEHCAKVMQMAKLSGLPILSNHSLN